MIKEVPSADDRRKAVMDEVYIALLDILAEAHQVVGDLPFMDQPPCEQSSDDWTSFEQQDAGYPLSLCTGETLADLLRQPIVYRSNCVPLGDVLKSRVQSYAANADWLDKKAVDEVFAVRAHSHATVATLEIVQANTLAVMDAIALYESLKNLCISPGQIRFFLSGNPRVFKTAGMLFPPVFSVTEHEWVFEPVMSDLATRYTTEWPRHNWCFHAFVNVLYRLIMHGGTLQVIAFGDRGSFSLSAQTLRGVGHLGND